MPNIYQNYESIPTVYNIAVMLKHKCNYNQLGTPTRHKLVGTRCPKLRSSSSTSAWQWAGLAVPNCRGKDCSNLGFCVLGVLGFSIGFSCCCWHNTWYARILLQTAYHYPASGFSCWKFCNIYRTDTIIPDSCAQALACNPKLIQNLSGWLLI